MTETEKIEIGRIVREQILTVMQPTEEWTITEAAYKVNKDRSTIHRWYSEGKLKAKRMAMGRPRFYPEDVIQAFGGKSKIKYKHSIFK